MDFLVFIQSKMRPKNLLLNVGKTEIVSNDPRIDEIVINGQRLVSKKLFRL